MKKLGFLCILLASGAAFFFEIRLARANRALATDKEVIRRLQLQAAPKGGVAGATQETEPAQPRTEVLEQKIVDQQRELENTRARLRLVSDRLQAARTAPQFDKGSFTILDGTVVYAPDTQVRLRNGALVSSPTGVMVSDGNLEHIDGDLLIDYAGSTGTANNAFISFEDGHMKIVADSVTMHKK